MILRSADRTDGPPTTNCIGRRSLGPGHGASVPEVAMLRVVYAFGLGRPGGSLERSDHAMGPNEGLETDAEKTRCGNFQEMGPFGR